MTAAALLPRLDRVQSAGEQRWRAVCPAHQSKHRTRSLSIRELEDGRLLLWCFAGCGAIDVLAAVGLEPCELFPAQHRAPYEPERAQRPNHWHAAREALQTLDAESLLVLIAAESLAQGVPLTAREHAAKITAMETKGREDAARLFDLEQTVASLKHAAGVAPRVIGSHNRALQAFMKDARLQDIAEQRGILRVKSAQPLSTKALLTSLQGGADTSPTTGFDVAAIRDPNLYFTPSRVPTLLDVMEMLPMQFGNQHEFVQIVEGDSSPGNPDSGADYQILEGDEKPEADVSFALRSVNVATIAIWQVMSRQLLNDVPTLLQQMGIFFSTRVRSKLERELIVGPGGTGRIRGLSEQATPYVATGEPVDRIGEALADLEGQGFMMPFILMHPAQWNDVRSGRASGSGEYTAGSWAMPAPASIWGAPVIRNSALPVGTALIVDRTAARFIDRMQPTVEFSTEDADNFRKNLCTILCEVRGTLEVTQPTGVLSVALDTSP